MFLISVNKRFHSFIHSFIHYESSPNCALLQKLCGIECDINKYLSRHRISSMHSPAFRILEMASPLRLRRSTLRRFGPLWSRRVSRQMMASDLVLVRTLACQRSVPLVVTDEGCGARFVSTCRSRAFLAKTAAEGDEGNWRSGFLRSVQTPRTCLTRYLDGLSNTMRSYIRQRRALYFTVETLMGHLVHLTSPVVQWTALNLWICGLGSVVVVVVLFPIRPLLSTARLSVTTSSTCVPLLLTTVGSVAHWKMLRVVAGSPSQCSGLRT